MNKLIWLVICLGLLALIPSAFLDSAHADSADAVETNWQYRWGDSPLDANGIPVWTNSESNDDQNWISLVDFNEIGRKQSNSIWYRISLKNIHCDKICSIKISRIYQNYEIYLDRSLLDRFGEMSDSDKVVIQGRSLNQVSFTKGQGDYLYYRVHSGISRIGLEGTAVIGEQADVMMDTVKSSIPYGIITVISMVAGLILVVFSCLNRQKLMFISGLFILLMGEYTFILSDIKYLLFPGHELFLYNCKIISEYILPVFYFSYTYESLWGTSYRSFNRFTWFFFLMQACIYIVYSFWDITAAQKLFTFFNLSVLISFIFLFVNALVKYLKHRNFEVTMLLLATFSVMVASTHDVLRALLLSKTSQIMHWGLFSFMICLCVIFVKRYYDIHIELQNSNRRLDELHKQKDQIFANTSHELRTPLTGMIGLAESLMSDANQQMKNSLEIIVSSGRRLSKLINDILDISSMNNKTVELDIQPVNVFAVAETVVFLSKPLVGNKLIEISNTITPTVVLADEDRLQQIFHNLLSNAIKFTEQGYIELSSELEPDGVVISVKDTGIGIPQEKLAAIFEPFEQVDGSLARKYGGTGLGLHVTKQLVELHGGTLTVESKIGQYTVFSFKLPVGDRESPQLAHLRSAALQGSMHYVPEYSHFARTEGKVNLLVVDDEWVNLQVLYNLLTPYYGVTVVNNGAEALEWLDKSAFDLVVLDVMMPGLTGFEVCSIIRQTYTPLALPVILISAYSTSEYIANSYKQGANEYITKPFIKQEVLTRIDAQLKLKLLNEQKSLLSEKEKEILRLFEKGMERKDIREALFISESTLKNHITKINKKFGTKSIQEAVALVRKEKMI